MLAVLNHRASAYEELTCARTRLMGLRETRSGLFIKKGSHAFSCHTVLNLLAEIAAAKLHELSLMLSLDVFEKQLREEKHLRRQHRVWLGSTQPVAQEAPQPKRHCKTDRMSAFLLAMIALRCASRPRLQ